MTLRPTARLRAGPDRGLLPAVRRRGVRHAGEFGVETAYGKPHSDQCLVLMAIEGPPSDSTVSRQYGVTIWR